MKPLVFDIDPDITRAWTPPARVYTDPAIYETFRRCVFERSWQLIGHVHDARVPGEVRPFTLLEGCLDEPLLLVRDTDDTLRVLSNVCTHRGNLICEQGGVLNSLRCRYHGRRFALNGAMTGMPEFETAADFPSGSDNLPSLPVQRWGPFLFTTLAPRHTSSPTAGRPSHGNASAPPAPDFDAWIAPLRDRTRGLPIDACAFDASRSRDYLVAANWALYCENYLEGFHIPYVHAGLNEALDYGAYTTELFDYSSLQIGIGRGGDVLLALPPDSPDRACNVAAYYFWLFPNVMFNIYPWGISVNVVKPLGVARTRVSFLTYIWDESKWDQGAGSGLDRVEREDEAIVEAVQKGVRSRLYDRGRYSPTRETGTHHFHRLLAAALRECSS